MAEITITSETSSEAPVVTHQRPEHIPEKFWDAEKGEARWDDLAKSYGELQAKLGAPKDDTQKAEDQSTADTSTDDDKIDEQNKAAEAAGIDIKAVETEFADNGALSEDTYAKFEAAGISKDVVDEVIELRTKKAEEERTALLVVVGGEEGYAKAIEWAAANWTKDEIETYNSEINSGDIKKMKLAVKALAADFGATKRSAKPNLLKPSASPGGSDTGVYESLSQLMADQRDTRYGTDPAFTKKVEDKLARSKNF